MISIYMFNSGIYWGILIVIFGILLVAKQLLNLDFPVVKVMIGIFLISLGIRFMFFRTTLSCSYSDDNNVVFRNKDLHYDKDQYEYNVVFSNSTIDFREMEELPSHSIEINTVFGDTKVILDEELKVDISSDAVFGAVHHPNPEKQLREPDSNEVGPDVLRIQASAVFGQIRFIRD
ncbi:MAG: hypothetical protein ISR55_10745 [Bacteroidetes bacterium]|nr:hypothetical protein [Bacteroidota bacterium]